MGNIYNGTICCNRNIRTYSNPTVACYMNILLDIGSVPNFQQRNSHSVGMYDLNPGALTDSHPFPNKDTIRSGHEYWSSNVALCSK